MGVTVFEGLDEIDWRSMHHAYESAWNVPGAIRGLLSRNADKRAWAQDYMWGAVHHQGDVYDCTVAAIPFLIEAAAKPTARGRGQVVKLLASIGGADREGPEDLPDGPMREQVLRARRAVAEAYPVFVTLLDDPKRKVRAAAAQALLACPDQAAEVAALLVVRVAQEPKKKVRNVLIETLCTIAERADAGWLPGINVPVLRSWFTTMSTDDPRPDVRIAALVARLRTMPDDAGEDPVPVILDLLAKTDADMRDVSVALGARVPDRIRLISAVLREGPRNHLGLTRWAASRLMTDFRGDYGDLMRTCGDLLSDPDGGRRACAIFVLANARPLGAPAADAMVDYVARAVGQGGAVYQPDSSLTFMTGGPVWQLVSVLAELRDERALPYLVRALDHPDLPENLCYKLGAYGAAAEPALPPLRERLAAALRADDRDTARHVLHALIKLGAAAEAVPVIEPWLADADPHYPGIVAFWLLRAAGPAAAAVAPALRQMLTSPDADLAMEAADTLWAIEGNAEELLPVYERVRPAVSRNSFSGSLHQLGPAAAPLAGYLREMLDGTDGPDWFAATTLWEITGNVEDTLPALVRAWTHERYAYRGIAGCWAEMGPRAAVAEPLLRAELADPTRATYDGSSEAIPDDERFVVAVAQALAAVTGDGTPAVPSLE
jgi:HEAT repeat protein